MKVGDTIVMTRGHYKGRPGVVREVYGNKCTITLTDTPSSYDVMIRNVTSDDYKRT